MRFTHKNKKAMYTFAVIKKYKAVIYDWDGCLIRSLPVWIEAYKRTLKKVGIKATSAEIIKVLGNWEAPKLLGHPDLELANKLILGYVHASIYDVPFYPDVLTTIMTIRDRKLNVFIVTSTRRETTQLTKAFKEVENLIDFAVFADDVKKHKPDPEAINLILKKFKLKKADVLMVGDSDKDILAARNAGIDSLWFAPTENETIHDYNYLESLAPTGRVTSHKELADLFNY